MLNVYLTLITKDVGFITDKHKVKECCPFCRLKSTGYTCNTNKLKQTFD